LQNLEAELTDSEQVPVWGCNKFIHAMALDLMDNNVEPAPYDLSELGVKKRSQIELHCTQPSATPGSN
jgi:hypothetical protein